MIKTVSKPLAHLNFLSGVNCYDIGSRSISSSHGVRQHRMAWCQLGLWSGFGSILWSVCNCICALKLEKHFSFLSLTFLLWWPLLSLLSLALLLLCCSDCHSGCLYAVALCVSTFSSYCFCWNETSLNKLLNLVLEF